MCASLGTTKTQSGNRAADGASIPTLGLCVFVVPASLGLREIIRYEPYSNGSFSDSGCDPVHGAGADVACGEDAWDRGLEKHRLAGLFPGFGKRFGDLCIATGKHETLGIT